MSDAGVPSPLLGLVAALVVLIAGIAAALTRDTSSPRTVPRVATSTQPSSSTTTSSSSSTTTTTSVPATSTTVRPAVSTPEAAANGLWAAYAAGDRSAAGRFANESVANTLFEQPYSGETGTFQGCRERQPGHFDCDYQQPSAHYAMRAEADADGSFKIVLISVTPVDTTTSSG